MKFLFTLGLVLYFVQIGICYQCFECNGSSISSCGIEFDDETTNIKSCAGDCLKFHYDVNNNETIYKRDCAGPDGCDEIKKELNMPKLLCQTCSGNYCNNGP
ncbi:uncharacterized protein LOC129615390 [Condylostylus longicornis]|uniref:uncharacterized protein LOC129615390 n=1 Tax=Condylostylus longicornis TaxID=2530218 RepID=UPI00244E3EBC|nr:uncharacterized protein LOC129615390 [Condylostylus longicornis]